MPATPPPIYDSRSMPHTTTLTPYLRLPHLLSLTWLAYPILSLLFVAFRLELSSASAQDAVASAKDDLLASCKAAEQAATAAASMPRYMAAATNVRISEAVNDTMNGARATLVLALTIMEAVINFIVDTYRSTFLCFLELVVRGGLSILIGAVQELNSFVTSTFSTLRTSIQSDVSSANSAIQSAVSAVNKINPFGNISIPQFSIPSLDSLQNVTLPTDFEDALVKLNSSLPTLSDLKDKVDAILDTPFELVKKDINDTFAGLSFDVNALPVPAQNTVTFCGDMDTSVVDDLGRDLVKIAKIGVIILILVAILLIAANCALEWYKWRCMKNHMRYTREAWTSDPTLYHPASKHSGAPVVQLSDHNLMMLQGNMLHPLLTKIANRISGLFRLSPSQHIHLSWFFHYVFHPPALACFLIGFVGLLSVQIQLIAVSPLAHKYSEQAVASANSFSNTIATSINASMYNQSAAYANDINGRVDSVQSTINDGLFGWVNGTTTTLNNTINEFYNDIQDAVTTVFNGTILESPVQEFIRCFIGSKVDAIEEALTFLHNNLIIDIPRVNDTVLVLSPADVNEATQPIAAAAVGSGNGNDQGFVGKLVNTYIASLKKERIMFFVFIGLWGVVVLMALCVIFWHSYGQDWVEAYKRRKWRKEQRAGINGTVVSFKDRASGQHRSGDVEKTNADFPPFAPRPRPFNGLSSPNNESVQSLHPPHPLSIRRPAYEKSWDSFLDEAQLPPSNTPSRGVPLKIGSPQRLVPFRKGPVDMENISVAQSSSDGESTPTWMKPFTAAFWKKKDIGNEEVDEKSPAPERARPQLTITTSNGSVAQPLNSRAETDPVPSSAWSVSPRRPTWLSGVVMPTLRPKPRRTASIPSGVASSADDPIPAPTSQERPFAVPLHHGFAYPGPQATRPPPPNLQLPAYAATPPPVYANRHLAPPPPPPIHPDMRREQTTIPHRSITSPDTSTPVTRLLTTHHARHSSQVVNPFATPFDDEHSVVTGESRNSARQSSSTNPFIAMAI
ncbi:hypothetical protein EW026_g1818 [Hermanssonia centrifuga]|uniref:Plasma membrane fusion protein PRM1 n=1 Tax=Hermanssonia centrifuga TaxID=98765 RepID=A0A4S4KQ88_9APHY|nr:hypothetical protein EW026_g1818 [Hermanssonia centrifuga]